MIPDTITTEDIPFKIGRRAQDKSTQNALRCEGQTIPLPLGNYDRLYLLAASTSGDTTGKFTIGTFSATLRIQDWTNYIGSWDNRVFEGEVKELTYSVDNPLKRIDPGYIKRAPVAWYCDHRRTENGADMIYSYCYLFKYALPVPPGAKTLTLPDNTKIRILAITAANDPAADIHPASPLYDDFTNRPPIVLPAGWANSN